MDAETSLEMKTITVILCYLLSFIQGTSTAKLFCKSNLSGGNYMGEVRTTSSGRRCQRWDSQDPHRHDVTSGALPDESLAAAENFCRSPDFDTAGPWCFTSDPDVEWEYCVVPNCQNEGCRDTESGVNYIGTAGLTERVTTCRRWSDVTIYSDNGDYPYAKTSFPDGNIEHAYCRNPLGQRKRPWCHVLSDNEESNAWDYCNVPLCATLNEGSLGSVMQDKGCQLQGGVCVSSYCCTRNNFVSSLCAETGLVCCISDVNCNWNRETAVQWPHGSYGLPMTSFGCPGNDEYDWLRGQISLRSETGPLIGNLTTDSLHLLGPYDAKLLTLNLCLRDNAFAGETVDWPKGNYCVFKFKDSCPQGLSESSLNIGVADGLYELKYDVDDACDVTGDTSCLYLCCRDDGESGIPITLPTDQPFYLLQNQRECQEVDEMDARKEVLHLLLGPSPPLDLRVDGQVPSAVTLTENGLVLGLCFYEMTTPRPCYDPLDKGFFYRGHVNVTSSGVCSNWNALERVSHSTLYDYVGLEDNNFCRNTVPLEFQQRPWCFSNGQKVHCDIEPCDSLTSHYQEAGLGRPARQADGSMLQAQFANDGDLGTCSKQMLTKAWWQMDLQGWYDVIAVRIYRVNVESCVVRMANVYIGKKADDFLTSGALMCARNVTLGASSDALVQCEQPVRGQFVTLQNLVYIENELGKESYEKCLELCEVVAYVKDTYCGRRLLERTRGNEIQPIISSNDGQVTDAFNYILQNPESLCLKVIDGEPQWIKVDFLFPRRLQGILTQGSADDASMVTAFTLSYGLTEGLLLPYEDFPGRLKVFVNDPDDGAPQQHELLLQITARLILIEVSAFTGAPCMRLDFIGCINAYSNLLTPGTTSQSSQYEDKVPGLAVDGDVSTCSETRMQNATWWASRLPEDVVLHSLVLKTGWVFPWNLAVRRRAMQLSEGWGAKASYTVDGRTTAILWEGSCSTTYQHDYPWWAVDLGSEQTVKMVKITNRLECCETRNNKFGIVVGNVEPVEGEALNTSLYETCVDHDRYFNAGETRTLLCTKPVTGRYLAMYLKFKAQYLTICEVMVFGDRAPFYIGVTDSTAPGGRGDCQLAAEVPLGGLVHSYRCPVGQQGRSVVAEVPSSGAMALCDMVAYGGSKATLSVSSARGAGEASCEGADRLHVELLGADSGEREAVRVGRRNVRTVYHVCEGAQKCRFPVQGDGTGEHSELLVFYCSQITHPSTVCREEIREEGTISTPNFPYYYGLDLECSWIITAPTGSYVALNVTNLILPNKVTAYWDGCLEVEMGDCADTALVYYGPGPDSYITTQGAPRHLDVTRPALFIADTDLVTLRFKSCYRNLRLGNEWQERLGLRADVSFQACHGCQVQSIGSSLECSGQCGQIVSPGFPSGYADGDRTQWTITVDEGRYVTLTFVTLDIYESSLAVTCVRDYVEVLDVDLAGDRTSLGSYCNSVRPPTLLKSSWSQLDLLFISDADVNGRGFHAVYHQNKYELAADFPDYGPSTECPTNWTHFEERCYSLVTWSTPLIWMEAEAECLRWDGHLAAINSRQEMVFLHFMLTTEWRTEYYRTFIGLNDRKTEGQWQWVDGSPVTYTDWSSSSDYPGLQQPDGANVEDCVMIRLDSIHNTRSWHDIPCAFDKVQQFLCEKATSSSTQSSSTRLTERVSLPEGVRTTPAGVVRCENGEFVLSHLWCDGRPDCHDESDEYSCVQDDGICSEDHFRCLDGTCVPLTNYCDFITDCQDGSDEASCVRRSCDEQSEFRCESGECVDTRRRCDLLPDCQDGSDERNCDRCASDVAFQCFDGNCIPRGKRCDSVADCPGALHEDEGPDCTQEKAENSCQGWRFSGYDERGRYLIQPQNVSSFEVECDMTSHSDYVTTIVHHDTESSVYISGYSRPGEYERQLDYGLTKEQLKAVTSSSVRCEQYVSIDCYGAESLVSDDFWRNIDGEERQWTSEADDCNCILTSSCDDPDKKDWKGCICAISSSISPRRVENDAGYLTSLTDLPITAVSFSGIAFVGEQYLYQYIGPLVCYQYGNRSRDDLQCATGQWVSRDEQCVSDRDRYGDTTGCRDMSHLRDCGNISCPVGFIKCAEGHCVPVERVCDGASDCVNGQDELGCGNFTCPGHLRCQGETVCVTMRQRCDGIKQCRAGNDEWFCDVTCPDACTCTGLDFHCQDAGLSSVPLQISPEARKLNLASNTMNLTNSTFTRLISLGELVLRSNGISQLPIGVFSSLSNLYYLDLSNNSIEIIYSYTFQGLGNLKTLLLVENKGLMRIEAFAFAGLDKIEHLQLRGLDIEYFEAEAFGGMPMIKSLDLSGNNAKQFHSVLRGLDALMHLNVTNNPHIEISRKEFLNVPNLISLESDFFKYCCFVKGQVTEENCLPKPDEFSSCEDLMKRDVLKVFLWVLGLMAFVCNLFVLIYRRSEKMTVYSFSVMNLAVADFFMGTYMVCLASVDAFYRGVYIEFADTWTNSWVCQFLGFINTLSSETSVFTLCLISADRFYKIVFPLKASHFGMKQAKIAMGFIWLLGFSLSLLPLMPISYFGDGFYGKSSVCISIYLTQDYSPGWQFSIGIFHGMNFMCFVFIFVAYAYLFHVVKRSASQTKSLTQGQKPSQTDVALARRLTLVVFTDFLCWVPINSMGVAAGAGAVIPGEVYAWVVVFLLPINSAINPLLYTISSIRVKAKQAKDKASALSAAHSCLKVTLYKHGARLESTDLKTFLGRYKVTPLHLALDISRKLAAMMAEVHAKGYYCPSLDPSDVILTGNENDFKLSLDVCMVSTDDHSEDLYGFGKLTSYLLRRLVATT